MEADATPVTIDVTVGPGINCANDDGLRNAVTEGIAEHVRSRKGLVRDLNVLLPIIECDCDAGASP